MNEETYLASYFNSQKLEIHYEDSYKCVFQSMFSVLAYLCSKMLESCLDDIINED